jgi:hypothetical protein
MGSKLRLPDLLRHEKESRRRQARNVPASRERMPEQLVLAETINIVYVRRHGLIKNWEKYAVSVWLRLGTTERAATR